MTTIKSFTDLEQSKKLAEFLPLETADMCYMYLGTEAKEYENIPICAPAMEGDLCAWSLAVLLCVLPNYQLQTQDDGIGILCSCNGKFNIVTADNPVDACVAMIEKLHKLKML